MASVPACSGTRWPALAPPGGLRTPRLGARVSGPGYVVTERRINHSGSVAAVRAPDFWPGDSESLSLSWCRRVRLRLRLSESATDSIQVTFKPSEPQFASPPRRRADRGGRQPQALLQAITVKATVTGTAPAAPAVTECQCQTVAVTVTVTGTVTVLIPTIQAHSLSPPRLPIASL